MAFIKLSIAEPCRENWNDMLPEEKGRFCLSCQKTVIDFTTMSDRQVFEYFKNYKGDTCGQFSTDQLNREVTKPKTGGIGRWKYFWQILLPALLAFQKPEAQPKKLGKVKATPVCKPVKERPVSLRMGLVALPQQVQKPEYELAGSIISDKKQPVPFATVSSSDGSNTVADSLGQFKILLANKASLTISQVGYVPQNFTIDSLQTNNLRLKTENGRIVIETLIELRQSEAELADVTVVGYKGENRITNMAGGISVIHSETIFKKQRVVHPDETLPQLNIFPNPVRPGQNFQITCKLKETGNYVLQITDAAGRIMMNKKIGMPFNKESSVISGEPLPVSGIYFLTLLEPAKKNTNPLQGKIVVQ